ncbi:MAG: hypothetical protein M3R44_02050 [Candidatus Eremiobacteraeota bacterium]|nr:hypothetical protein [Candidatus Eremiobacteraeota bacterium]
MSMPSTSLRFARGLPLLILIAIAVWSAPALAERTRDVDLRAPLSSGATLEIDDVNGSIAVTPTAGGNVMVHAHASTDGADPGPVVRTSRSGNRLIVCAVFPGDEGSDANGCSHNHMGGNDDHFRVDLRVGVPRGIAVDAHNVNGPVSATGLGGIVNVSDVNGAITIRTKSNAGASNVNGAIEANFSPRGNARFTTVNGPVTLIVPTGADATFRADTLSGAISSDGVDLSTHNGQFVGHSATATLGAGHARISVHTVNGAVRLERR